MKSILFLEVVHSYGGARASTLELAKRLSNTYDVKICDLYGDCRTFISECEKKDLELEILLPNKKSITLSEGSIVSRLYKYLIFLYHICLANMKLRKIIKSNDISHVVVNNNKVLSLLLLSKKLIFIVYFVRTWNLVLRNCIDKYLYRTLVDRVFCVSQATRQAVFLTHKTPMDKMFVVPNAISINQYELKKQRNNNVINLFSCTGFLESKGVFHCIEIAKELKESHCCFKWVIAGIEYNNSNSKQCLLQVEQMIVDYELSDYVQLIINSLDMDSFFKDCDLFIHPTQSEGLPRVTMEAMSYGKVVLTNPVGGTTDLIINNYSGFIMDMNDIHQYVSTILRLTNEIDLRCSIGSNAKNIIEVSYTETNQVKSFMKGVSS